MMYASLSIARRTGWLSVCSATVTLKLSSWGPESESAVSQANQPGEAAASRFSFSCRSLARSYLRYQTYRPRATTRSTMNFRVASISSGV